MVSLQNPFSAPLRITNIQSNITAHGFFLGSIVTDTDFTSDPKIGTVSPVLDLYVLRRSQPSLERALTLACCAATSISIRLISSPFCELSSSILELSILLPWMESSRSVDMNTRNRLDHRLLSLVDPSLENHRTFLDEESTLGSSCFADSFDASYSLTLSPTQIRSSLLRSYRFQITSSRCQSLDCSAHRRLRHGPLVHPKRRR